MNTIPKALIEKLRHPDPNERSGAVFELDRLHDAGKLPLLIEALRTEFNLNVREDLTYAIMHMGILAVPPLIDLLKDDDEQVRHHAVHTLGKIGHADAADALINALQDEDSAVVLKAVVALNQIADTKAVPALIGLLGHENQEVQTTLANVLEQFGTSAVPSLIQAIKHDHWQIRERAAEILGVIEDQEAVPALISALQDAHWQVRFAAVMVLGSLGGKAAKGAIQPMQADPNARVSTLASRVFKG